RASRAAAAFTLSNVVGVDGTEPPPSTTCWLGTSPIAIRSIASLLDTISLAPFYWLPIGDETTYLGQWLRLWDGFVARYYAYMRLPQPHGLAVDCYRLLRFPYSHQGSVKDGSNL